MCVSLSAFYEKIEVRHVEAGLRTHDSYSPWPEEINRRINGVIAKYHYAPTEACRSNLIKENVSSDAIITTGNTVIDTLLKVVEKIESNTSLQQELKQNYRSLES